MRKLELWVDKDILYFGLKEDEKSHIDGFVPVSWGTVQSHFNDFIDLSLSVSFPPFERDS